MSLFKLREFWRVNSHENDCFDQNSMLVSNLNTGGDYILTGSQSGVLRLYKPSSVIIENRLSNFCPTDLLFEKNLETPILQLACGRLAS